MGEREGAKSAGDSVFAGEMVVVVEVIYCLAVLEAQVVYVAYSGCPFEIVVGAPDILVFIPPSLNEPSSELSIASLDNEHFLIDPNPIPSLPSPKINHIFPFLSLRPLLLVFIILHLLLLLFLAWRA